MVLGYFDTGIHYSKQPVVRYALPPVHHVMMHVIGILIPSLGMSEITDGLRLRSARLEFFDWAQEVAYYAGMLVTFLIEW